MNRLSLKNLLTESEYSDLRRTAIRQRVLDFCNDMILIYEKRVYRRKFGSLVQRLRVAVRNHFKERERDILMKLQWAWKSKMEAVARELPRADWITMHIFDLDEERELLATILNSYYLEAGEAGVDRAITRLSKLLKRDIIYRGTTAWVQDNAINFGKKYAGLVSKTTNQAIRNEIAEAIKQGEDLNKVMKRIASVYKDAEGYRSEMIARTEMQKAYNIGSLQQDAAMGLDKFEWFGCNPACPICGPFIDDNPHTADEVYGFSASTHPNCNGDYAPIVPEDFEPNLS